RGLDARDDLPRLRQARVEPTHQSLTIHEHERWGAARSITNEVRVAQWHRYIAQRAIILAPDLLNVDLLFRGQRLVPVCDVSVITRRPENLEPPSAIVFL